MDELETARKLISTGKYKEASRVISRMLRKNRENDQLWYFLGLLSLKMKNYDLTDQYLDHALSIKTKPEYFWLKGMAYLELLEMEAAAGAFRKLLEMDEKNADANFFLSVCYLLMDDPQSERFLKRAYKLNKKRTKQLLRNFFETFIKGNRDVSESLAAKIADEIKTA